MGPGGVVLLHLGPHVHPRFSKDSAAPIESLVSHCRDNGLDRAVKVAEMVGKRPNPLLLTVSAYIKCRKVLV